MGLPTLVLALANNQIAGARALQAEGAALLLADQHDVESDLKAKLKLFDSPALLAKMQQACFAVTEGTGALRLAAELANARA